MYAPIYWHLYTAEVEMMIDLGFVCVLLLFFTFFSITVLSGVKRENNSVVELDLGTICRVCFFVFFYLFMSGSPSPSILVCHVSSAGSRGGGLLPHAWVWEEDSRPLLSPRHTWMTRLGLCLCEKHSRNGTSLSQSLHRGSEPSTLLWVCVLPVPGYDTVCLCTCASLIQLGGMS